MSLTSYRAAPPRGLGAFILRLFLIVEDVLFLSRFGGDLLSHVLRRSTIGATALNFRVRDGIGCLACAVTTKPGKEQDTSVTGLHVRPWRFQVVSLRCCDCSGALLSVHPVLAGFCFPAVSGSDQAYRAISTGQLSTLLRLHLRPIDVVVYHGPDGETLF